MISRLRKFTLSISVMGPISKVTLVYLTPVQEKKLRNTFYTTNMNLSIVSIKNHTHTQNVIPEISL